MRTYRRPSTRRYTFRRRGLPGAIRFRSWTQGALMPSSALSEPRLEDGLSAGVLLT